MAGCTSKLRMPGSSTKVHKPWKAAGFEARLRRVRGGCTSMSARDTAGATGPLARRPLPPMLPRSEAPSPRLRRALSVCSGLAFWQGEEEDHAALSRGLRTDKLDSGRNCAKPRPRTQGPVSQAL